jgi:hypothetical protein
LIIITKPVLTLFEPHWRDTLLGQNQSPLATYRAFIQHGTSDERQVERLQLFEEQWQDYYRAQRDDHYESESAEGALFRTRAPTITPCVSMDYGGHTENEGIDNTIPDDRFHATTITYPTSSTETLSEDASAVVKSVSMLRKAFRITGRAYNLISPLSLFQLNSFVESIFHGLLSRAVLHVTTSVWEHTNLFQNLKKLLSVWSD